MSPADVDLPASPAAVSVAAGDVPGRVRGDCLPRLGGTMRSPKTWSNPPERKRLVVSGQGGHREIESWRGPNMVQRPSAHWGGRQNSYELAVATSVTVASRATKHRARCLGVQSAPASLHGLAECRRRVHHRQRNRSTSRANLPAAHLPPRPKDQRLAALCPILVNATPLNLTPGVADSTACSENSDYSQKNLFKAHPML